jgi:hypothetical protein
MKYSKPCATYPFGKVMRMAIILEFGELYSSSGGGKDGLSERRQRECPLELQLVFGNEQSITEQILNRNRFFVLQNGQRHFGLELGTVLNAGNIIELGTQRAL